MRLIKCNFCKGTGKVEDKLCPMCKGTGVIGEKLDNIAEDRLIDSEYKKAMDLFQQMFGKL